MTERHGGWTALRSVPATTGHHAADSGGKAKRMTWKLARNGVPLPEPYEWNGIPEDGDPERDGEVARLVAEIRAEAVRRVLKPGEKGWRMNAFGEWVPFRRPKEER